MLLGFLILLAILMALSLMSTGAAMSHATEAIVGDLLLRGVSPTADATIYIGLYTVAPDDTGGGTEVAGNGYVRQAITFAAGTNQSSGRLYANSNNVVFPAATAGWGTVVAWGIFTASSAGTMKIHDSLTNSQNVTTGQQPQFPIGSLTILFD